MRNTLDRLFDLCNEETVVKIGIFTKLKSTIIRTPKATVEQAGET
jgi:hypothetical protein